MHIHNQNIIHNDNHYYSNPLLLQNAAVNELYDPCFFRISRPNKWKTCLCLCVVRFEENLERLKCNRQKEQKKHDWKKLSKLWMSREQNCYEQKQRREMNTANCETWMPETLKYWNTEATLKHLNSDHV